ncbi:hypothetical protein [Bradyrhizobium phage BDU-MI-1]|nr:hypothetical protein [Bradyrhizobium phage BDU-MI-1]
MKTMSAEQLKIRPAELKALLEIRELFAKGVFHHDASLDLEKPDGFNMNVIDQENECGTTCCIGGWMFRAMQRDRTLPDRCYLAQDYVATNRSKALVPLFHPFRDQDGQWLDVDIDFPYELIPPAYALAAIDNVLTTGDPDWASVCVTPNQEVRDVPASLPIHGLSFA